jgi:hypothetical protein
MDALANSGVERRNLVRRFGRCPGLASTNRHVVHARYDEHAEKAHGGAFSAEQESEFWRQFRAMT